MDNKAQDTAFEAIALFEPDSSKVERERRILNFEEYFPDGRNLEVETYRAMLVLHDYVGKLPQVPDEVHDAWHEVLDWCDVI